MKSTQFYTGKKCDLDRIYLLLVQLPYTLVSSYLRFRVNHLPEELVRLEHAAKRLDVIRYARAIALLSPLKRHLLRLIPFLL
ncbi:hypothetical protein ACVBKF_28200, partial [Shewanella sp. 0m-11]